MKHIEFHDREKEITEMTLYHFPVIFQTRINTDLILIKYLLSQT